VQETFDSYRGKSVLYRSIRLGLVALGGLLLACGSTRASTLFDFKPIPISPGTNEFSFSSVAGFTEGPGSVGNGDGLLPVALQSVPGLQADTPFTLPGIPGSTVNADGSTTFYDVTMHMGNMTPIPGQAANSLGTDIQVLNTGTFTFTNTTNTVVLLSGTITTPKIEGDDGGDAGAFFKSNGVTYTGGVITAALQALAGSAALSSNSVTYDLNDVTPTFGITGSGATALMNNFVANGDGNFTVSGVTIIQPEPSTLALAGIAIATLTRRGKRAAR
jgi:hypothetical protein